MLYFEIIDVLESIDVNKTNASQERDTCPYWHFFLYKWFKLQPNVSNGCHDVLMMSMNLRDIGILSIKGVYYRFIINIISKS